MEDVPGEMTIDNLLKVHEDEGLSVSQRAVRERLHNVLHRFMRDRRRGYTVRELRQYTVHVRGGNYYFKHGGTGEETLVVDFSDKSLHLLQSRLAAFSINKLRVFTPKKRAA